MLRLFVALVVLGLALACITSWVLDGYDTAWHPKRSLQHRTGDGVGSRGSSPPFPGGEMNNIFWFIQVSGCPHIHLIFLSLPRCPDRSRQVAALLPSGVVGIMMYTSFRHTNVSLRCNFAWGFMLPPYVEKEKTCHFEICNKIYFL